MTGNQWPDTFETILRRHLPLAGAVPLDDRSLIELGMDSRALVAILVDIEDAFEVEFPDEYINLQRFGNAVTLWSTVDTLSSDDFDRNRAALDPGPALGG